MARPISTDVTRSMDCFDGSLVTSVIPGENGKRNIVSDTVVRGIHCGRELTADRRLHYFCGRGRGSFVKMRGRTRLKISGSTYLCCWYTAAATIAISQSMNFISDEMPTKRKNRQRRNMYGNPISGTKALYLSSRTIRKISAYAQYTKLMILVL